MSESREAAVVEALHALQERLSSAHLSGATADDGELARDFNVLLLQAKEVFPQSDTLRLIEALTPGVTVPVLAVRLVLMRRTIDATLAEPAAQPQTDGVRHERHGGGERRRWRRRDVAWPVRFLFGDGAGITARAVDASRHGLRLVLDTGMPPAQLTQGDRCGVEVYLGGSAARFFRNAQVSHVDARGVGLTIPEALPPSLLPPADAALAAAADPRAGGTRSLTTRLWSLFVARRGR
ncbi:MAG TPA: PilZ domain-containing protein [Methylomirabilota bacterium]|nr:PilZ domain-containing protein [Methylomirabilota bacterium]